MDKSFNAYIENSIRDNWELTALSDFKGVSYSYKDIARKIEKMHILMEAAGIKKGDKIAICGRNSSRLGRRIFRYSYLRSRRSTYPARIQARQCTPHRQPFRSKATFCRRCRI